MNTFDYKRTYLLRYKNIFFTSLIHFEVLHIHVYINYLFYTSCIDKDLYIV